MTDQLLVESLDRNIPGLLDEDANAQDRLRRLNQILRYVVAYLTEKENIFFSSYFSRISFLASKYSIPGKDIYLFHAFRKLFPLNSSPGKEEIHLGLHVLYQVVYKVLNERLAMSPDALHFDSYRMPKKQSGQERFRYYQKIYLKGYSSREDSFLATDQTDQAISLDIEDPESRNDLIQSLDLLSALGKLPIKVSLFDTKIEGEKMYPGYYVLDPDFLVDVTSISESFDSYGISVAGYGLRKLIDKRASVSLHIGNIANVILDEMVYNPQLPFDYFLKRIFKINPLAFASFTNDQVRALVHTVQSHYQNIREVVTTDFQNQGINLKTVFVEPSFYAPRIGIQGRFDLLHNKGNEMHIVELKSGKSFQPNTYGLNNSHYHQTLLYDLILSTNMGKGVKRNNFILYSAESERTLRYAPTIKAEQREAMNVRNQLLIEEYKMQNGDSDNPYIIRFLKENQGKVTGFKKNDLEEIAKIYESLSSVEKAYWDCSFAFLSREYALSKVGDELSETNKGLSTLWQMDPKTKKERFLLLERLTIAEDRSRDSDPGMVFHYSMSSPMLSNFRKGDIVILYPTKALQDDRMTSQVFKCTLLSVNDQKVEILLRSKQMNPRAFSEYDHWNIEHDILDSSYAKTFRQLYHFANADEHMRTLLMGVNAPSDYEVLSLQKAEATTEKQHAIIERAISAQDYFLIWGPPGTGKTSIVTKEIIAYYNKRTSTRLLVLAYTNRAVDEICEAIESIDHDLNYIRIGSRFGCDEKYRKRLLNHHIEHLNSRKEVKKCLAGHQIYVGTVASVLGKPELFDLLSFGVCLVDEASQILESGLIGILTRVKKFILIGDHRQLPAIVLQNANLARIKDESLRELGFESFAASLFERLYTQALNNNWSGAYSQLTEQGRMHSHIMTFVNNHFYKGQLEPLLSVQRLVSDKAAVPILESQGERASRMIFIPSLEDRESGDLKINRNEAEIVVKVVKNLIEAYKHAITPINGRVGIITPFRAQIAQIKSLLTLSNMDPDSVTVDTVERYQGGSRDIIIISAVVNSPFQLSSIISMSEDGVDRKLNVAITRAKEQVILIGNEDILSQSEHYKAFIREADRLDANVI